MDQKYIYQIIKMINIGELDFDALIQVIGPVNHGSWLTTANRQQAEQTLDLQTQSTRILRLSSPTLFLYMHACG